MKKHMLKLAIVAFSATTIGFCAAAISTSAALVEVITATGNYTRPHATAHGKYCSGSVSCDCSGFSPITNGKEWQKSYCKKCGHYKSCHR